MMFRLVLLFMLTLLLSIWMGWGIGLKLNLAVWAAALVVYFWLQPPNDRGNSRRKDNEEEPPQEMRKAA